MNCVEANLHPLNEPVPTFDLDSVSFKLSRYQESDLKLPFPRVTPQATPACSQIPTVPVLRGLQPRTESSLVQLPLLTNGSFALQKDAA